MSCFSSAFGRRYLNSRYSSVSAVGNGRARQERRPQVPARALLYGADGEQQVQRLLASFGVAQPRHTVVAGVERQVLELVALIDKEVVDAHLLEVHHVVRA